MMRRFTVLALALLAAGQADTIRLRNGSTVTGTWLGGDKNGVRFMVDDQVRVFPRGDVAWVDFTSDSMSNTAPPIVDRPAAPVAIEPDVTGVPFMRGASGLITLEAEVAMMARTGGGMYGMGGTVYRIQGPQSPVRVRRGDKVVFVVRLNGSGDPRRFQLYQFESRMNYRETRPTMGGQPPSLPLTVNKISDSSYEITPSRPLYPGEYSISPMGSNVSYCFGVDY